MKSLIDSCKAAFNLGTHAGTVANITSSPRTNVYSGSTLNFNSQVSILYVEDNVINQALGMKVLKNIGCVCEIASSGIKALELLREKSYDLILMDINMPELDGLETTKYLRQNLDIQTPVIAVTTNIQDEDVRNCMNAGMNDHVGKPYSQQQLSMVIFKWCKISN